MTACRRSSLGGGVVLALVLATLAMAADAPRYDVAPGFTRCPEAVAWNGFFKWASVERTTCGHAKRFLHRYARAARTGPMPRRLGGFKCRIRFWTNAEGDIYASRHRCRRGREVIRFYGMV